MYEAMASIAINFPPDLKFYHSKLRPESRGEKLQSKTLARRAKLNGKVLLQRREKKKTTKKNQFKIMLIPKKNREKKTSRSHKRRRKIVAF